MTARRSKEGGLRRLCEASRKTKGAAKAPAGAIAAVAAALAIAAPLTAQAGGELQYGAPATQPYRQAVPGRPATPSPGPYAYNYCLPYPYAGPGSCTYYPPPAMTHYAPSPSNYPGYAHGGHGPRPWRAAPYVAGGLVGFALGAHFF